MSGEISGFNDLENQLNMKSASVARGGYGHDTDTDFEYRGVTNSNNLDSVFRSSATNTDPNTSGQNSSSASTRQGHSRYNSVLIPPMDTMHEGNFALDDHLGTPYPTEDTPLAGHESENHNVFDDHDRSSEYDLDDELLFNQAPHQLWTQENHSNNSRLRFTEEI